MVYERCAGLDVHKKTVVACVLTPEGPETRPLGTMTAELRTLADWLLVSGCTHVAMESTGDDWKPVFNILEGTFEVLLVNAQPVKAVPGRKTDVKDAAWLAELLPHGLWRASFIPPVAQRERRDLTRYRSTFIQERVTLMNRVQKRLEDANIKLAVVATDIMGVSGRAILAALIQGRADPATMAELAKGRMRTTLPLLEQALTGLMRDHHRRLLTLQWAHSDVLDEPIGTLSMEITRGLGELAIEAPPPLDLAGATGEVASAGDRDAPGPPMPCVQAIAVLDTIPGVDQRGAELLVAEWGTDMRRFGTASRLSAWTGVAPGHDERAGKQRSGKTRRGNRTLRTGVTQIAHDAARTKGTSLSALSQRLAARRGKQCAILAVAHALMVSALHLLSRHEPYRELGANSCDAHRRDHLVDRLTRRIQP